MGFSKQMIIKRYILLAINKNLIDDFIKVISFILTKGIKLYNIQWLLCIYQPVDDNGNKVLANQDLIVQSGSKAANKDLFQCFV